MKDVLLPVGSIVKLAQHENELPRTWMIIGRRIPHPKVCLANDYAAVPYPDGYQFNLDGDPQMLYFDHYEIDEVVRTTEEIEEPDYRVSCSHKNCPICNGE